MAAWSAFYPDLMPELPGLPCPLADHWLRNVAIEFCERSKAHRVDLAAMNAVADQMAYTLTPPENMAVVEVVAVMFDGNQLDPKSIAFLAAQYGDWQAETGTPAYYTQQALSSVLLVPAPAAAATGVIKVKAAVKPAASAATIDDTLFARWRLDLVAGVKAKLMAMDKVPWANPDRVAINLGQFEDAIAKATVAANSGFVRSRPRYSGRFC